MVVSLQSARSIMRHTSVKKLTDSQIFAAVARGNSEAYDVLVEGHQRPVYAYLRARLLEPADADDLCQEVFLRGYTNAKRFGGDGTARAWLIGIARNVLREHLRRVKRRNEVVWIELCLDVESNVEEDERTYDDVLGYLPDCLDALGPSARSSLDMRYAADLRHAQIAEKLRRSADAVKLMLYRARQALRRCLDGKLSDEVSPTGVDSAAR